MLINELLPIAKMNIRYPAELILQNANSFQHIKRKIIQSALYFAVDQFKAVN